ncbi:ATP-binding cassette domain-containing protein [Lacrimispora sp. JR3]|uniref:ATP-binding cassette domain-containing protein n=1 Tax=Lacrimispora sinapis TaxID=3111456 RepID=UPI00374985E8
MVKIIKLEKRIENFQLDIKRLFLQEKKIHGLIGKNGSGKSTLIKLITGLMRPDQGTIDYGGLKSTDITFTTQRPYMLHDTVYQNLIYPLKLRKKMPVKEEIEKWLDQCGLAGKEQQFAPSLSSGERQKLSFARALIFKPKLVFIDETMANMDAESIRSFQTIIMEIQKENPITWVIVSHQPAHIDGLCQEVHLMEAGRHLFSGTPKEMGYFIKEGYETQWSY